MNSNSNPFGALDKMLLASSPVKKKDRNKVKGKPRTKTSRIPKEKRKVASPQIDQSNRPVESTKRVNQAGQPIDTSRQPNQSGQSVRSTHEIEQSTNQLMGEVVRRPLAFYIPVSINDKIEEAVRYYQKKHHRNIDRSAVVSAVLGNPKLWEKGALDKLSGEVILQLKNRLNDRLSNRLNQSTR